MRSVGKVGKAVGGAVLKRFGRAASRLQETTPLPVDVLESDDQYLVVFDAPGATASDVQVRYVDDEVQVRIDRFRDYHEGFEMRFPGRGLALDGRAKLPADAVVDAAEATARLNEDGTLYVFLPKGEEQAGKQIAVEAADADTEPVVGTEPEGAATEEPVDEAFDEDELQPDE
ncbi:Hsp20/alpha crystallin family protein [Halobacteriaceae archaeon GCM10025711]